MLIAPIDGESQTLVANEYVHELATRGPVKFVTPRQVMNKIEELSIQEMYDKDPISALESVAKNLKADGVCSE